MLAHSYFLCRGDLFLKLVLLYVSLGSVLCFLQARAEDHVWVMLQIEDHVSAVYSSELNKALTLPSPVLGKESMGLVYGFECCFQVSKFRQWMAHSIRIWRLLLIDFAQAVFVPSISLCSRSGTKKCTAGTGVGSQERQTTRSKLTWVEEKRKYQRT